MYKKQKLDQTDSEVLNLLSKNSRIEYKEISEKIAKNYSSLHEFFEAAAQDEKILIAGYYKVIILIFELKTLNIITQLNLIKFHFKY